LPVDIWQRVQSDNVARFTIQGTEGAKELRLQALGLSLDQNKSQVVTNHEISRVNEPISPLTLKDGEWSSKYVT